MREGWGKGEKERNEWMKEKWENIERNMEEMTNGGRQRDTERPLKKGG